MLISAARRAEVLQWAQTHRVVQVNELADSMGVSSSTIRRDLRQMEQDGLLRRVHGGAVVEPGEAADEPHLPGTVRWLRPPRRGGSRRRRRAMVQDDSTILISGGTTTETMLALLGARENLTVVTNSLNVATGAGELGGVDVIVLGGYLRRGERSLLGRLTHRALSELVIDRMFTGAFGLDGTGVTGAHLAEAETDQQMMAAAPEVVVLADSTKFGRRGAVRLTSVKQISTLITDSGAEEASLAPWREAGVEVVVT